MVFAPTFFCPRRVDRFELAVYSFANSLLSFLPSFLIVFIVHFGLIGPGARCSLTFSLKIFPEFAFCPNRCSPWSKLFASKTFRSPLQASFLLRNCLKSHLIFIQKLGNNKTLIYLLLPVFLLAEHFWGGVPVRR